MIRLVFTNHNGSTKLYGERTATTRHVSHNTTTAPLDGASDLQCNRNTDRHTSVCGNRSNDDDPNVNL